MRAGITPRMCPLPIPRMSKNEATESQRQSEAIRGNQRQSGRTSGPDLRCNQAQSDAIRRNQVQSGALCFRVFVFWAGRKGLCSVFLCFGLAQRACVCCCCFWPAQRLNGPVFCVFVFWQTPLYLPQNTARGQFFTVQNINKSFTRFSHSFMQALLFGLLVEKGPGTRHRRLWRERRHTARRTRRRNRCWPRDQKPHLRLGCRSAAGLEAVSV